MSIKEISRLEVIQQVKSGAIPQLKAAEVLGISVRQLIRLKKSYEQGGAENLLSKRRTLPAFQ